MRSERHSRLCGIQKIRGSPPVNFKGGGPWGLVESVQPIFVAVEWLDHHIRKAEKGIRFINSRYSELFRIADGEKIEVTNSVGEKSEYVCRYIDEYHTEVGNNLYHICQFAEIMERNGSEYTPVEPETVQAEEKEQGQEEKTEGTLELKTRFGNTQNVTLEVQQKK